MNSRGSPRKCVQSTPSVSDRMRARSSGRAKLNCLTTLRQKFRRRRRLSVVDVSARSRAVGAALPSCWFDVASFATTLGLASQRASIDSGATGGAIWRGGELSIAQRLSSHRVSEKAPQHRRRVDSAVCGHQSSNATWDAQRSLVEPAGRLRPMLSFAAFQLWNGNQVLLFLSVFPHFAKTSLITHAIG